MGETQRRVRWGILGVARINERLIPALQAAGNAELRAISSRSLEKARKSARDHNIPIAYGSYEQLLDDPEIDAIYNPLPNSLHAEWTIKAAESGKHTLCEKPLASDAQEAQRMVEACRRHRVRLMDGFMWPHHPRTHRLRAFLDEGGIGKIGQVTAAFTFRLPIDQGNIRLRPELAGGSVMDVGCYPVYGARWVFGSEPTRVFASAEWHNGVDLTMNAVLDFSGDRRAIFDCGFTLTLRGSMEINGMEGRVWVQDMWLPRQRATFKIFKEGTPATEVSVDGEDQIVRMVQNFSQAVLEGRETTPGPEEAVKTMRVLDALRRSAREGVPVTLA